MLSSNRPLQQILPMQALSSKMEDPTAQPSGGSAITQPLVAAFTQPQPQVWNDVGSIRSSSTSTRYRHISALPPPPPPVPKISWKKRLKDAIRATVAFIFSKVGICVLVIGYLFIGAAMFHQLEGKECNVLAYTQWGKMPHFLSHLRKRADFGTVRHIVMKWS